MKNRKLPFGYRMKRGIICVDQGESELVKLIFEGYAGGKSYGQLVNVLKSQPIPYNGPDSHWNKNIIARILQNPVYTGEKGYPEIITQAMFDVVQAAVGCKRVDSSADSKTMRSLVCCANCNRKLIRNWRSRWNCPNCTETVLQLQDETLQNHIQNLLAIAIRYPSQIVCTTTKIDDSKIQQINASLKQELDKTPIDEAEAKHLILSLASTQIEAISSADYETIRIHHILTNAMHCKKTDVTLLQQIASAVLLYPDGSVSIKLKNGQIFGRSAAP